jgi:hypothetical protein
MLAPVETALKTALAALVTDWPIRWPNERFDASVPLSDGGLPVDTDGEPAPFIDAEVIAGRDSADIAPVGSRHSTQTGLFRVYLSVGQGTGLTAMTAKADAICAGFKRKTVFTDLSIGQRLVTMDGRTDDGVAGYQDGSRFVRMISIPWWFDYIS